jgi:hydrogenase maturation protein HypF
MHPDYLSTKFASGLGVKLLQVQHHHAHIASCLAEHGLDEKVIGVSFDGTGFGTDGNIWGGEFLICDLNDFERFSHFEYIKQPGGDAANKHPWRMLLSYLYHYFGKDFINKNMDLFFGIHKSEIALVLSMIEKNINCPLSSSSGRLFDAVSALIGACQTATYHAEAPMRLESMVGENKNTEEYYPYINKELISFKPAFEEIIKDIKGGVGKSLISAKFHNTIVEMLVEVTKKMKEETGINKVALSGGTFQNRIILEKSEKRLTDEGFKVFTQSNIPSNDGGIALGQLAIAAKRRGLGLL